jgi:hypothetical protein
MKRERRRGGEREEMRNLKRVRKSCEESPDNTTQHNTTQDNTTIYGMMMHSAVGGLSN